MNFKTDFLAEDYSELCWFQAKPMTIVISAFLALAVGFTLFGISSSLLLGIGLFIISFPIIYKLRKNGVINRADRRYSAYGASSELFLEIDDDEIRQTGAVSGNVRLPWQDVYEVRESKNCYYVFLSKAKAFYFPKRSFESEEQKQVFFDYIKKYVPEKKIKLKK